MIQDIHSSVCLTGGEALMFPGAALLWVVASYLIGCFTAGYYVVRFLTKEDIHTVGSGNVGARNVGRVLGRSGFVATLLIDIGKGMFVVWVAQYVFEFGPYWTLAAYLAVIVGHIWPLQFRFHGGKGVATGIGVMLMLGPFVMTLVIIQFLIIYAFNRSFTLSGQSSIALTPFTLLFFRQPAEHVAGVAAIAALFLFTHRQDIWERLHKT